MKYVLYLQLVLGVVCSFGAGTDEAKSEPVRIEPIEKRIEGWTVHVDPQLLEGPRRPEGQRALEMLANHLQRISILLPEDRLKKMRQLEIWIEWQHPNLGSMQYHPSRNWLRTHNYDPRLAKKVHIPRANALLSRQQMFKHPMVILHELAHAYHDQCIEDGFNNSKIIKAYRKAKESGKYENVLLYNGKNVNHYALTDHKEYFAEGTESYFYRNDFYPFVGAELKEHDPKLYALLEEIWGPVEL